MEKPARAASRLAAVACALGLMIAAPASAADLDLETLDGPTAVKLMDEGKLTSVELTRAYIARIAALNKRGPGLNAVSQLNSQAIKDAALLDKERKEGKLRGPAHGLPVLLKDLIDVKGMYTSAGNFSLRNSFPAIDSGVAKKLRESGVVILGKLGLSEYANYFGNQPSGFANLTGQVLNAVDADQNPSGSSSGSGSASAAALSTLVVGTETSGSIISPSQANGLVGLRPTVGLVPGYGIAPISASQDTAGPMDRTVANAALTLQSIAGYDAHNAEYYKGIWGAGVPDEEIIPPVPATVPNYVSALDLNFVRGKRIGYNGTLTDGTPLKQAYDALAAAGAILVERPVISPSGIPGGVLAYEAKRDIGSYYKHLGPDAPIKSVEEEMADNTLNAHEALKFGNATHASAFAIDISPNSPASVQYRSDVLIGKQLSHSGIDRMMQNDTPADPSDDFIAILGSVSNGARAGYPQMTIPMGYNDTLRRTLNVSIHANAYKERDLIGVGYVIEQGTKLRKPVSQINPSMYRCADTTPKPAFAERGACNPDYKSALKLAGGAETILPFSLETESASSLRDRLASGTLTSEALTKAYLTRIALVNAEGPALQAVRSLNADAVAQAKTLDTERAAGTVRGPLHGLPVLLDDTIDAAGLPTTGGSIALQNAKPAADAALVTKLKAAGAIVLGKTNVTELGGLFDANLPEGYSSLGGQVLLPSDTDKTPAGSSAGSAAATASGLAALTIGTETSTDTAQLIAPAGVAGVVGLKPSVGAVSTAGVLPIAKAQDAAGPITRTVADAATAFEVLSGKTVSLNASATGTKVAVINSTAAPYPAAITALTGVGATTVTKTIGTPANVPSIVTRSFEKDLNAYLGGKSSLAQIVAYNTANPVEGLKYQQRELTAALSPDLTGLEADTTAGQTANAAVIDALLADTDVIMVPSGNALVGYADRAGYPVLTVPAGFGTGSTGRNPIGVTFVAAKDAEAKLLSAGYAFEQATKVRQAPSYTNPSMFRCVPGSTFFSPHHCHPGDLESPTAAGPNETAVAGDVGGTVPATLSLTLGTPPTFGTFIPGVARTYSASTKATVISTAGDATLTVADPSATATGHLVNGSFSLPKPLGGLGVVKTYTGPVSNDEATVTFTQEIGANDALRTGTYSKTLVYTLSTTTP
ncbi:amidase family protein [Solirubrobacter phytolaccae]|uniref:Amidase family protein n=1 Tax=Solirubrobacter phytolaccae TaxID=1404360 RepID=A0A9X3SDI9_9ACTN|nr:amidase family protein [Solirubrobacter phytolaccae]MDA0183725.1 amidase family protein [Solirubrobacter phytolaccae]